MADFTCDTLYVKNIVVEPAAGSTQDAILIKRPDGSWGAGPPPTGVPANTAPQALRVVDHEDEDRFRVDAEGGVGIGGAVHLATSLNSEGSYQPTQAFWYDPKNGGLGFIISTPPTTNPETGLPINFIDHVIVVDTRADPDKTTAKLNGKLGVWTSLLNRAPLASELVKGEIVPWGDPAAGVISVTMKKNDGTLVTKVL